MIRRVQISCTPYKPKVFGGQGPPYNFFAAWLRGRLISYLVSRESYPGTKKLEIQSTKSSAGHLAVETNSKCEFQMFKNIIRGSISIPGVVRAPKAAQGQASGVNIHWRKGIFKGKKKEIEWSG